MPDGQGKTCFLDSIEDVTGAAVDTAPLSPAFDMPRPVSGWEGILFWSIFVLLPFPSVFQFGELKIC